MRRSRPRLILTDSVIEALGGAGALTRKLGFNHASRIANWAITGIPRSAWPELLDLARHEGLPITMATLRGAEAETGGSRRCAA